MIDDHVRGATVEVLCTLIITKKSRRSGVFIAVWRKLVKKRIGWSIEDWDAPGKGLYGPGDRFYGVKAVSANHITNEVQFEYSMPQSAYEPMENLLLARGWEHRGTRKVESRFPASTPAAGGEA